MRGYFGIGIYNPKTSENIGTLWRSAYQMGASFIFTIGARYKKQCSDTYKTYRHIPLIQFNTYPDFKESSYYDCRMVMVEFGETSECVTRFKHPERAIYILGSEDNGFSKEILEDIDIKISIPSVIVPSYNVAVSGSIVMYDRLSKQLKKDLT